MQEKIAGILEIERVSAIVFLWGYFPDEKSFMRCQYFGNVVPC